MFIYNRHINFIRKTIINKRSKIHGQKLFFSEYHYVLFLKAAAVTTSLAN